MEQIIQYLKAYLDRVIYVHAQNMTDLDATASAIKVDSDELSRKILETLVARMNESVRKDKSTRKEMGLVLKEKDRPRCILTELGEIRFSRDYYYNKNTVGYETPLDKMLNIDARARIGAEICSKLVTKATVESYERSTQDVTEGFVSRQSVRNQILKAPELEKQPEDGDPRKVKYLEVYADEDHVHLQKPGKEKGKKNKMVPLVTVAEGIRKVSKSRNETINSMHFVDEKMDTKDLWDSVEGYIEKAYDLEYIEEIRLHSDGGRWIKSGLENFSNAVRALDKWHIQDYIGPIERMFPKRKVRSRINNAIRDNNRDVAEAIIGGLVKLCSSEKEFKKIKEFQTFLFNHWEEAVNAYREDMCGSCTEGLVSHVLSDRFSRNPMGWSEEGLGKLSKLRVYCKNGGEITAEHFKTTYDNIESYKEYAHRILNEQLGSYDLSWLNDMRETYVFDTASGTQQAIKKIGRCRTDIFS